MKWIVFCLFVLVAISEDAKIIRTASIKEAYWIPFTTEIAVNTAYGNFTLDVTQSTTHLGLDLFIVEDANAGTAETLPNLVPLENTSLLLRGHIDTCIPNQGGYYYQNDPSQDCDIPENEIWGEAKTDETGRISFVINRDWPTSTTMRSLVIHSVGDETDKGRLLCADLIWKSNESRDGALSSSITFVSFIIAGLFVFMMI
ncbi:hypothetical protein WA158_005655 [Blastocystis sp. Blastoise]